MPTPSDGNGKRSTKTSAFGVSRREAHDSSDFYARFTPPVIDDDDRVCHPDDRPLVDQVVHGDIRTAGDQALAPNSVALVVTSPPYYAGKDYELEVGQGGVPKDYFDYLEMLRGVFERCVVALEPGGRMAVNVANLGRKPYRSLSRDVIDILEDLGLLLRGEVIWQKAQAASGNCAWGTYQQPGDPVLRDLTERVIIASKQRFDRAVKPQARQERGLPHQGTIMRDEFLEATTDVWQIPPESATRVNHPAPFPVALPTRLIELYTYRDDLVVDPFGGSGTTAVACINTERRFVCFDTDASYVALARDRVAQATRSTAEGPRSPRVVVPMKRHPEPPDDEADFQSRAVREGRRARELAEAVITECGFTNIERNKRVGGGIEISFVATDRSGAATYCFDVSGAFTSNRAGLRRTDTLWKALGKATVLRTVDPASRYVLLTTDLPAPRSSGRRALDAVLDLEPRDPARVVYDAVQLYDDPDGLERLHRYAES